jgi:hypothetical protein
VLGYELGSGFESIAGKWLCNKKFGVCNMVSVAVCWSLWKLRIFLYFQGGAWTGMRLLWRMVPPMLRSWRVLVPVKMEVGFEDVLTALDTKVFALETVAWRTEGRDAQPDRSLTRDGDGLVSDGSSALVSAYVH